jgi:phage tail-like protein
MATLNTSLFTADMAASPGVPFVTLAADRYNRYSGEQVQYFLRFAVPQGQTPGETLAGSRLQIAMPKVLTLDSYRLPDGVPGSILSIREDAQDLVVSIPLAAYFKPGFTYEAVLVVGIHTFQFNQYLIAEARITNAAGDSLASEEIQVAVIGKGRYLQYLPELYESDDFMGRFLMLFESFWKPIAQQIDQADLYYDPLLTPQGFLPWLASWIGLPIDPSLPVERKRELVKKAMVFFQCRGTAHALQTYLEIFTSGKVTIIERRGKNFVLSASTALGIESALGKENRPNTLSVHLCVPAAELERTKFSEDMYHQKMVELVRWMVPAHAVFDVSCEFDPDLPTQKAKRT